ncbi:MAG: 2-hydroxyacid dehydrogenase [Candidatus Ranarchaeia archaeon]|jgi:glyoxylate reductase
MYKVFVTSEIPSVGLELLRREFNVRVWTKEDHPGEDTLRNAAKEYDGMITLPRDPINEEFIDACEKIKVISQCAGNVDNIAVEAAHRKGIVVTYAPVDSADAVADLTWALILNVSRFVLDGNHIVRRVHWSGWNPNLLLGSELQDKTLGIIGLGQIGSEVARRAMGFKMKVIYHSGTRKPSLESELNIENTSLSDLLQNSDIISLHLPYSLDTENFIGEEEFGLMKPSAILINTSHGKIVDENELVRALTSRSIAGAGLDVYQTEPPSINNPLLSMPNVVLTPHIGDATILIRSRMSEIAANNVIQVLSGNVPDFPIDLDIAERSIRSVEEVIPTPPPKDEKPTFLKIPTDKGLKSSVGKSPQIPVPLEKKEWLKKVDPAPKKPPKSLTHKDQMILTILGNKRKKLLDILQELSSLQTMKGETTVKMEEGTEILNRLESKGYITSVGTGDNIYWFTTDKSEPYI